MTEEEAKTKWCPFVTSAHYVSANTLIGPRGLTELCCVSSGCMAWRWSETNRTAAYLQAVVEHMKATGDNFNKATQEVVKRRDEFAHTDGFCGLAGAPA